MRATKRLLQYAAIGLGALMLTGCVAESGYYSETYSGVIYEEPVYAEPMIVIDDRLRDSGFGLLGCLLRVLRPLPHAAPFISTRTRLSGGPKRVIGSLAVR